MVPEYGVGEASKDYRLVYTYTYYSMYMCQVPHAVADPIPIPIPLPFLIAENLSNLLPTFGRWRF